MKRYTTVRYASVCAVLAMCCLAAPAQAGGLKGRDNNKHEIKIRVVEIKNNFLSRLREVKNNLKDCEFEKPDCRPPNGNPCVPEQSSLLGSVIAGAGLCGVGLYRRRRNS